MDNMDSSKKKILIIHHGGSLGGGLYALLGVIEELRVNNEVEVLTIFNGVAADYIRRLGITTRLPHSKFYAKHYGVFAHSAASYFEVSEFLIKAKFFVSYLLSKYFFAQKELDRISSEFDLVYLNSSFISDWARAAKRLNKKVIIHIREPLSKGLFGFRKSVIRNTIKKYCDRIIAITKDNASRVNIPNKTTIIYDPVVTENRNETTKIEIDETYKYFTYVGGMLRIKGFEQMVRSLEYLNDNVRIFFLGKDVNHNYSGIKKTIRYLISPYSRLHNDLVRKLKESDKVIFIGQTDDVFSYIKVSVALISPFSRPHAALPILEAFSLGVPVIVSDIEGMNEVVVEDKNGFFFKNGDPKSLANKINRMLLLSQRQYNTMKTNSIATYSRIRRDEISVSSVVEMLLSN